MMTAWVAETKIRQAAVSASKTPQSAARALAYQEEAEKILEKAMLHQRLYAASVDLFDPTVVFK